MRIVSWNINGIRTLPKYHPWNTFKTFDDILNHLQADIICFQEVKASRSSLPKDVAIPESYLSFFSFPLSKTGYSGVVTYTRTDTVVPLKAEEGLTSLIQPHPPLSQDERLSCPESYPPDIANLDLGEVDYKELDGEGRAVSIDLGFFVLINVYCPNGGSGSKEREDFKMRYHRILHARVDGLIQEGRQVMVVGDLNACAAVVDHCEGPLMVARGLTEGLQGEDGFWSEESRRWVRDWLIKDDGTGCLVDIIRQFWPDRKGMYTCWNTKISARETNYGTRIDFILITPGLVPWIKAADIQPHVKGSDHCPIFVDLRDFITNTDGTLTKLQDVHCVPTSDFQAPRLAAKYWDEHKQRLLSTFFNKTSAAVSLPPSARPSPNSSQQISESQSSIASRDLDCEADNPSPDLEEMVIGSTKRKLITPTSPTKKIKISSNELPKRSSKLKVGKAGGQSSIATFFTQKQQHPINNSPISGPSSLKRRHSPEPYPVENADNSRDRAESDIPLSFPSDDNGKEIWRSLLTPTLVPKCAAHGEPAKEYTVNKPGPNKGKKFFICSRPVGPGYDKGRAERPREQVNLQFRCNFFKWSSDVRRQMRNEGDKI